VEIVGEPAILDWWIERKRGKNEKIARKEVHGKETCPSLSLSLRWRLSFDLIPL
jgi:hypothetical protein